MKSSPVPEIADGGYWYVLRASTDSRGNLRPPLDMPVHWGGVYGEINGTWYVLVRCTELFEHADTVSSPSPAEVIAASAAQGFLPEWFSSKPVLRVRGD